MEISLIMNILYNIWLWIWLPIEFYEKWCIERMIWWRLDRLNLKKTLKNSINVCISGIFIDFFDFFSCFRIFMQNMQKMHIMFVDYFWLYLRLHWTYWYEIYPKWLNVVYYANLDALKQWEMWHITLSLVIHNMRDIKGLYQFKHQPTLL